jgi:hypothetical protein
MKKFVVIIISIILLITPLMLNAVEINDMGRAIIDANRDARTDIGVGCVGGFMGIGAAYILEPTPSASRLLGKSPEYIAVYTDEYKRVGKGIQTKQAVTGFFVSSMVSTIIGVIYFIAIIEAISY